jgi:dynein light chain LC8-type
MISLRANNASNVEVVDEVIVRTIDMSHQMKEFAIITAQKAIADHKLEKDVAFRVKKELDKTWGPHWHCFVGRDFSGCFTRHNNNFIHLSIKGISIVLFKAGKSWPKSSFILHKTEMKYFNLVCYQIMNTNNLSKNLKFLINFWIKIFVFHLEIEFISC